MIKKYNQYLKENNIVYNQDEIDPYGEEDWDEVELTPVLRIAKKQGKPYDQITTLDCSNKGLTSLEGIENLINFKELFCSDNNLTSLEGIENLSNLQVLFCSYNNLTNLKEIEKLINLEGLYCHNNNLISLKEIENLTKLGTLYCYENNFSEEYKQYLKKYCVKKKIYLSSY